MYVITGATGNTGSVVARELISKGQKVRVIGRNADRLKSLSAEGAEVVACDITDATGLTRAFSGATGVYAMIPPNLTSQNFPEYATRVSEATAAAIEQTGVRHVVTLSSVGADKPSGTGPVAGLHAYEERLNRIPGLNVLHLRAGYFMENTLAQIGMIQHMSICAGPLRPDLKLGMIAAKDIGVAAAGRLLRLDFKGSQTMELLGQRDITMAETATIIGNAIGKPGLVYMQAPNEQVRPAMIQMGMSPHFTDLLLEMSGALNSGFMRALEPRSAQNSTPTSYETFVAEDFTPRYKQATITAA
ncbi:MAG: NAD(P)H-binding protein [Terriglobales bacterium]|jgi:uncharacterized protein YbjT (DUF2867 family)